MSDTIRKNLRLPAPLVRQIEHHRGTILAQLGMGGVSDSHLFGHLLSVGLMSYLAPDWHPTRVHARARSLTLLNSSLKEEREEREERQEEESPPPGSEFTLVPGATIPEAGRFSDPPLGACPGEPPPEPPPPEPPPPQTPAEHEAATYRGRYDPKRVERFLKLIAPDDDPEAQRAVLQHAAGYELDRAECAMDICLEKKPAVALPYFKTVVNGLQATQISAWRKQQAGAALPGAAAARRPGHVDKGAQRIGRILEADARKAAATEKRKKAQETFEAEIRARMAREPPEVRQEIEAKAKEKAAAIRGTVLDGPDAYEKTVTAWKYKLAAAHLGMEGPA